MRARARDEHARVLDEPALGREVAHQAVHGVHLDVEHVRGHAGERGAARVREHERGVRHVVALGLGVVRVLRLQRVRGLVRLRGPVDAPEDVAVVLVDLHVRGREDRAGEAARGVYEDVVREDELDELPAAADVLEEVERDGGARAVADVVDERGVGEVLGTAHRLVQAERCNPGPERGRADRRLDDVLARAVAHDGARLAEVAEEDDDLAAEGEVVAHDAPADLVDAVQDGVFGHRGLVPNDNRSFLYELSSRIMGLYRRRELFVFETYWYLREHVRRRKGPYHGSVAP